MKKIDKSLHASLPYITLYLDDLERVVDLMKDQSLTVNFSDGQYQYDLISEVIEKGGEDQSHLEVIGKTSPGERVILSIEGRHIFVYASNSDFELTWRRIKEFVDGQTPWYRRLVPWGWVWFIVAMALVQGYQAFIDRKTDTVNIPYWYHALILAAVLASALSAFVWFSSKGVVLTKSHSRKTFLSRNADRILMLLIGAAITLLAQYLGKQLGWR